METPKNTKISITQIMHSIVFLFLNRQENYNLLRSCTNSFKLFQLYASKQQAQTSRPQDQPKGAWRNPPSLLPSHLPSETDKQSLFKAIRSAPKVSAALHASLLLLKSLLKDGLSPIPLDKIEEKYQITFSRNTRKHDINSKPTATGSRPAGCGCCELGSYAMLS
jgi:hypothetical protein